MAEAIGAFASTAELVIVLAVLVWGSWRLKEGWDQ